MQQVVAEVINDRLFPKQPHCFQSNHTVSKATTLRWSNQPLSVSSFLLAALCCP